MLGMWRFGKMLAQPCRQFSTTRPLLHGRPGGIPGSNFPLNFDSSKGKITLIFILYFGIPLAAPWFVIQHQMLRVTYGKKKEPEAEAAE